MNIIYFVLGIIVGALGSFVVIKISNNQIQISGDNSEQIQISIDGVSSEGEEHQ